MLYNFVYSREFIEEIKIKMSQGDTTEARFLHLLQPIRDLTKNWEVDIASQLEDYLTEVREGHKSYNIDW